MNPAIAVRGAPAVEQVPPCRAPLRWIVVALARWFCSPLIVRGAVPDEQVVLAANHSSHADTPAVLAALPRRVRARTRPAAAEDYFFPNRLVGWLFRSLTAGFPFPRRGSAGLARARGVLRAGDNVLMFPEGTRSADGAIASFKAGVGVLAAEGATIVPVAMAGTRDVLQKGGDIPRRAPVVVVFGAPLRLRGMTPAAATARIEAEVRRLHIRASLARPVERHGWYDTARRFARSPGALWLAFAWGCAEAIAWPIVPDLLIGVLALAAPSRFVALALAVLAGSLAGGAAAYAIGAAWPDAVDHLPLVTDRMRTATAGWLHEEGARAVWHQPWSGVPFKTFAYRSFEQVVALPALLAHTAMARGHRFLLVATVFAGFGRLTRRWQRAVYAPVVLATVAFFVLGLARVVRAWS